MSLAHFTRWFRRSLQTRRLCRRRYSADLLPPAVEIFEDRCLLSAGAAAGLIDFGGLQVDFDSHDASHILVRFRDDANLPPGVQGRQLLPGANLWRVEMDAGMTIPQALKAFQARGDVLYAEPDYQVSIALSPDDSRYNEMWGLNNTGQTGGTTDADIDAPEAWDLTTGSGSTLVAIIDTGIDYTHRDLYPNIWINPGEIPDDIQSNLIDVDGDSRISFSDLNDAANQAYVSDLNGNGYIDGGDLLASRADGGWADGLDGGDPGSLVDDLLGYNFVNGSGDPFDDNGHGTHVGGTIGAAGNNGEGVVGVNWKVQLLPLKFLNSNGSGDTSDAISALNYAVQMGAQISNNSWGGGGYSQALFDAIQAAGNQGHIFVAAAGNGGFDQVGDDNDTTPHYPSNYNLDNIIAVAATDHNDALASFSNYGDVSVDLGAPGVSILSTLPGDSYGRFNGTSMATPHVAGVVALVRDQNPTWTATQVINQVLWSTDPVASLAGRTVTGGRLNAASAVGVDFVPRVVSHSPNGTTTGPVGGIQFLFSETIGDGTPEGMFTTDDIVSFTGPGGDLSSTISGVSGSGNTFTVNFDSLPKSAVGTYTMVIGPDIRDSAGQPMLQQYTATFQIADQIVLSSDDVPAPIQDWTSTISYLDVDQDILIGDIDVQIDVTHTWDDDLQFYIVGPGDDLTTYVLLSSFHGGAGDNYTGTIFDDEASQPISQGSAPFTGRFRPEQPLSFYDGRNARGQWRLVSEDWAFGDEGTLNAWSLIITPADSNTPPTVDDQTFSVDENSANGTPVGTVVASDPDAGQSWSYAITAGNNGAFTIDSATGEITVANGNQLDYETAGAFQLTVQVTDNGSPAKSDTATVTINLNDVNESPTVALTNTTTTLAENADTTSRIKVADILVTDDALGTNVLSLAGTDAIFFEIDGLVLYLKADAMLDHDANPSLDVTVQVDDSTVGSSPDDTADLSITVTEVNLPPTIGLTNTTTMLTEDADTSIRIKLADIILTDDGVGTNVLSLAGADAALFEIDSLVLYLKADAVLDYESNASLDVTVQVDDPAVGASPDDTADLSVTVTDVNEAPIIAAQTFSVDENSPNGTVVGTVAASDPDLGQTWSYAITAGNGSGAFAIDSSTGQITVADVNQLDYETTPTFQLTVQVTDNGIPAESNTAMVTINLNDVNESPTMTANLAGSSYLQGRSGRWWRANVTVTVNDGNGQPVSGATVFGSWSNGTSASGTTDSNGQVTFTSGNLSTTLDNIEFTLEDVMRDGLQYDDGQKSVTIAKPIGQSSSLSGGNQTDGLLVTSTLADDGKDDPAPILADPPSLTGRSAQPNASGGGKLPTTQESQHSDLHFADAKTDAFGTTDEEFWPLDLLFSTDLPAELLAGTP